MPSDYSKASWIASQLDGYTADDIYDVLLGNITSPRDLVNAVEQLLQEYNFDYDKRKDSLDSGGAISGRDSARDA
jgi:hypothetical protein